MAEVLSELRSSEKEQALQWRVATIKLADKERIKALKDTAGITDCGKGIRFYGYFIENEKTLVIEMTPGGDEE